MYTVFVKGNLRRSTKADRNAMVKVSSTSTLSALAKAKIGATAWKKKAEEWSKEKAQKRWAEVVQSLVQNVSCQDACELEQMLKEKVLIARENVLLHASMCYVFEDVQFFLSDVM